VRLRRLLLALAALAVLVLPAAALPAAAGADASPGVAHLSTLPEPGAVSTRVEDGRLYVSSLRGLSIYDLADPAAPAKLGELALPNAQNEDVDVGDGIALISDEAYGGRALLHVVDVRDPRAPRLISSYDTWRPGLFGFEVDVPPFRVRQRGGLGHTASCVQGCRFAWLAGAGGGIEVVDLRDPARPRFAGRFRTPDAGRGLGTHDVQVDEQGLAWVVGSGGASAYDVTDPARPRLAHRTGAASGRSPLNDLILHDSQRRGDVLTATEETDDRRCPGRSSLQTYRVGPGRTVRHLDSWRVERTPNGGIWCSAHYHDRRDGLVAQGWYEAGVRFLDVSDPRNIRQVGWWVPDAAMHWQAVFAPGDGGVVYALDHVRGIDVLRLDRAALAPRRRTPPRAAPARAGVGLGIFDAVDEVRQGEELAVRLDVYNESARDVSRDARVTVAVPAQVEVLPSTGLRFDRATRTVSFRARRIPRDRSVGRVLRVRVRRDAPPGRLEFIGTATVAGESFPVTDRGVDRDRIVRGRPRAGASGAWAGGPVPVPPRPPRSSWLLCRLP
jgi:hypothetical protein